MKVIVDDSVHHRLNEFYFNALLNHPALDEMTVIYKVERLYAALEQLGKYASALPVARLKTEWIALEYREYIVEDFHFAFRIYTDETCGISYVYVHDACHSLLYHE